MVNIPKLSDAFPICPLEVITWKAKKTKLRGLSPQANYTDRATAACRRS
jgi:hypothetical protein